MCELEMAPIRSVDGRISSFGVNDHCDNSNLDRVEVELRVFRTYRIYHVYRLRKMERFELMKKMRLTNERRWQLGLFFEMLFSWAVRHVPGLADCSAAVPFSPRTRR
jgi:hypothetical protein